VTEKDIIAAPFVRAANATLRDAILVAPGAALDGVLPLYGEPSPLIERAKEQHSVLTRTLQDCGVVIHPLEAEDDNGHAAFVADCAIVVSSGAIILRPHRIDRRREVNAVEAKLRDHGIPILGKIEAPGLLDGGDIVIAGNTAYLGVPDKKPRSNTLGRSQFSQILVSVGMQTLELPMDASIPRLSDVFSSAAEDLIVAATDFVDTSSLRARAQILSIPRGEEYGASLLPLGPRRVLANLRFRFAVPMLRKAKLDVVAIDLWEFGKVGGGPPSLVLPLKRA
jgi:N-dimethylarginine dimethylaminohydrolase